MVKPDFIQETFKLAALGETYAFPNPIVGSIVVNQGEIIGRGFHRRYGEAHAEVNAANDALENYQQSSKLRSDYKNAAEFLSDSEIYVSLEPCGHQGKTPPCADLIIKHKFKKLIYASYDPNPLVSGEGIKRIKDSGIEVIGPDALTEELREEAKFINRVFFKIIKANSKPYLTLKIAAHLDGSMVSKASRWITNTESRKLVHRLRSTNQLLVTSIQTIKADDPLYTVRHSPEELGLKDIRNPDIAILKAETDFTKTEKRSLKIFSEDYGRKIFENKVGNNLEDFLQNLYTQGYKKVIIEAGPRLSEAFLETGLVDEVWHFSPAKNNSVEQIEKINPAYLKYHKKHSQTISSEDQDDILVILYD